MVVLVDVDGADKTIGCESLLPPPPLEATAAAAPPAMATAATTPPAMSWTLRR